MTPRIDDRWIWLGFSVFLFIAAHGVRLAMRDIVRLIELDPAQLSDDDDAPCGQAEDNIQLNALQTLATHPNQNIANAATSLIVQRFAQLPKVSDLLHKDLGSASTETAREARTAIHFLHEWLQPLPPGASHYENLELPLTDANGNFFDDQRAWRIGPIRGGSPVPLTSAGERPPLPPTAREAVLAVDGAQAATRRSRREAMVLHDGDGRVEAGDIIRPPT